MPKFPRPEFFLTHWLTAQWVGLIFYISPLTIFALPYKVSAAANSRFTPPGLGVSGFLMLYTLFGIITFFAALTLYGRARNSAIETLMQDAAWQRAAALHKIGTPGAYGAPGWNPDFPVNRPDPKSYILVGCYGLLPAALLIFYIAGTLLDLYASLPVLVALTYGVSQVYANERKAYERYSSSAQHLAGQVAADDKRLAAIERDERLRELNDKRAIMESLQECKREKEAERLAQMRAALALLEARHVQNYADFVAKVDFDGTADRAALRRTYLRALKERMHDQYVILQDTQHPLIREILDADLPFLDAGQPPELKK